jgi:hypothetical protein
MNSRTGKRQRRQRGISLLLLSTILVIMLGVLGLAFDLGRMFVIKNELQAFCDSASLAAARNLDGTSSGLDLAHTTAQYGPLGSSIPNKINFDTVNVSNVADKYALTLDGFYHTYAQALANGSLDFRFVKVTASSRVPLYFLGVIQGTPGAVNVSSVAIAGQSQQVALYNDGGLLPFSVAAHTPGALDFGLVKGQRYTFKWGKKSASTDCPGDAGWVKANSFPAQRGYVDLGQGNGASGLTDAIEYGGYPNGIDIPRSVDAGDYLDGVPGNKSPSLTAVMNRSSQDPDQSSSTWDTYKTSEQAGTANGRRIVTVIIDDPNLATGGGNGKYYAIGFGTFMLDPASVYLANDQGGNGSYCATYLGPASLSGGATAGQDGTTVYRVMLFR